MVLKQYVWPNIARPCVTWCCIRCSGRAVRWCGSSSWLLCLRRHSKLKEGLLWPAKASSGPVSEVVQKPLEACKTLTRQTQESQFVNQRVGKSWLDMCAFSKEITTCHFVKATCVTQLSCGRNTYSNWIIMYLTHVTYVKLEVHYRPWGVAGSNRLFGDLRESW